MNCFFTKSKKITKITIYANNSLLCLLWQRGLVQSIRDIWRNYFATYLTPNFSCGLVFKIKKIKTFVCFKYTHTHTTLSLSLSLTDEQVQASLLSLLPSSSIFNPSSLSSSPMSRQTLLLPICHQESPLTLTSLTVSGITRYQSPNCLFTDFSIDLMIWIIFSSSSS
jgi:hypothetical protein